MTHRLCWLLLLISTACAQIDNQPERARSLRIRVALPNGQLCDNSVRVQLMGLSGKMGEGFVNNECTVEFVNVAAGMYHLWVSIRGVEIPDAGNIEVESRGNEEISVSLPSDSGAEEPAIINKAPVAVAELSIPAPARKQFDAASAFLAKENWKKAAERLRKAISIYPRYAQAYNNLAVANAKIGDKSAERTALQEAIAASDHFAPAYVNLARMDMADRDFPNAEALLTRAAAIDPTDATTLVLLADMQLLNQNYERAITTARKAHSVTGSRHASAHLVAAYAFETEGKLREALYELQMFLVEEGTGPRADTVRQQMSSLLPRVR